MPSDTKTVARKTVKLHSAPRTETEGVTIEHNPKRGLIRIYGWHDNTKHIPKREMTTAEFLELLGIDN